MEFVYIDKSIFRDILIKKVQLEIQIGVLRRRHNRMKEYKLVYLNKGIQMSREKDLDKTQSAINEYVAEGWELQQLLSPNDLGGALVGLFYKEK